MDSKIDVSRTLNFSRQESFHANDKLAWKRALEEEFENKAKETDPRGRNLQLVADELEPSQIDQHTQALTPSAYASANNSEPLINKPVEPVANLKRDSSIIPSVIQQDVLTGMWISHNFRQANTYSNSLAAIDKSTAKTAQLITPENYSVITTDKGNTLLVRDYFKKTDDLTAWIENHLVEQLERQNIRKIIVNGNHYIYSNGRVVKEF